MQKFVKGRTNQHLTFVMVDATDFATPESALSAAIKIKIYGKLRSATGVNFVSSGTGSLTNDIVHVGASALGLYTVALAKADLSDASAAWYDQYIISLSATGAAYQALVVDGGIDDSYLSNVVSYLSNVISYLSNMESNLSGVVSDIRSGTSDTNSKLVVMSGILSDVYSMLTAHSNMLSSISAIASDAHSAALVAASAASDAASGVTVLLVRVPSTLISNVNSMLVAGTFALGASNLSDIESRVWSADKSDYNASSQMGSLLNAAGGGADAATIAAKVWSDYQSKVGQTPSQVFSNISNYLSYISGVVSGLGAGESASAIADKVWSDYTSKAGASPSQVYSVLVLAGSRVSDIQSYLVAMSGMLSDTHSAATAGGATASAIADKVWSDFGSKVGRSISDTMSELLALSDSLSNVDADLANLSGVVSDFVSDFQSRVPKRVATDSQLSDLHSDLRSYLGVMSGVLSDVESQVPGGMYVEV